LMSVRAAISAKPGVWDKAEQGANERGTDTARLKAAVLAAVAFSLLNPHVYLDTVIVLGGIAAQYEVEERVYFALGAMSASLIWFFGIGYGATRVAPYFRTVRGARVLEIIIATIMFVLATSLVMGELQG
ncbi:MAG: LysE family transporter, partial [Rhodospirillales bacterium]|nr:LysE family transporter [Rhodospirillales bacterium]